MKHRNLSVEQALAAAEVHESNSRGIAKNRESEFDDNESAVEAEIAKDYRQLAEVIQSLELHQRPKPKPSNSDATADTFWVRIYASGPIEVAKQVCREYCLDVGLCVTVEPTLFVYTGGEESGFVIGLINYPKFPAHPDQIMSKARALAFEILNRTAQHSTLIMNPKETRWISKRPDPLKSSSAATGDLPHA